ncbi:MAG: hypothetical protein QNJ97_18480 [Myxococcota bacterium]|nr:hypothetical protein [Myxococcota bacterium]
MAGGEYGGFPGWDPNQGTGYSYEVDWEGLCYEGGPPQSVDNYHLIGALRCRGAFCHTLNIGVESVNFNSVQNFWTYYFSEEQDAEICPQKYFVTGIHLSGSYGDNISLECSKFEDDTSGHTVRWGNCYWTSYFSEEAEYLYLGAGYYMAGMDCRGSYCDNKSIYACQAIAE